MTEREINKIEIDTYLFVKWNEQINLGRFRQWALSVTKGKSTDFKRFANANLKIFDTNI